MILQAYLLLLIIGFRTQVKSDFVLGYSGDYYNPLLYYEESNATMSNTPECSIVPVCSVASNSSLSANETCDTFINCYEYKEFPENLPTEAKMLTIQDSLFTNITFKNMKNLTELIELAIEFNDIEYIEPNTFQAQKMLQVIEFSVVVAKSILFRLKILLTKLKTFRPPTDVGFSDRVLPTDIFPGHNTVFQKIRF